MFGCPVFAIETVPGGQSMPRTIKEKKISKTFQIIRTWAVVAEGGMELVLEFATPDGLASGSVAYSFVEYEHRCRYMGLER